MTLRHIIPRAQAGKASIGPVTRFALLSLSTLLIGALRHAAAQNAPVEASPAAAGSSFSTTHPCVHASVSGTSVSTALGQCSAPTADGESIDHFEADLRYGSFAAHHTDLIPYDFSAVPLVRSYVSRATHFEDARLDGSQPRAFGLNTTRFFDGPPVQTKVIERNSSRTLQEVSSGRGSFIRLAYDARSRILEADDDRNNTTRYFYGSDGMLCYAFSTSGMVRHYIYDGNLMTAVEDEHRHVLVRNSYDAGHLSAQQYANGDVYKYAYTWLPNQTTADSVTVTLPDQTQRVLSLSPSTF